MPVRTTTYLIAISVEDDLPDDFVMGRNGDESGWDTNGGYALNHRWL